MRFVRDEFVENYDPTIEGKPRRLLNALRSVGLTVILFSFLFPEEYRTNVNVDGVPVAVSFLDLNGPKLPDARQGY